MSRVEVKVLATSDGVRLLLEAATSGATGDSQGNQRCHRC